MSITEAHAQTATAVVYPDSDGEPMADNTEQFQWIVMIKENLEAIFADDPTVFVAGDLLWYPVEGRPDIRRAPDAMVVFGRPKGRRGSYRQWEEDGIAPQVVFEVLSPGNRAGELMAKQAFYERYGVEEYYLYDPDTNEVTGALRDNGRLAVIEAMDGWVSPRLGITFRAGAERLELVRPDGEPFISFVALQQQYAAEAAARTAAEEARAAAEEARVAAEEARATEAAARTAAEARAERLVARLRAMGIDPDASDSEA